MSKIINSITISLLLTITFLSAQVRFDLRFTDPDGVGFNHPNNEWMIKAVQDGADILGKCIKQNAFVTIKVFSEEDTYAYSKNVFKEIQSSEAKKIAIAMDKILSEDDKFSGIWEGKICFNTNSFSEYDTLRRVTIHELTHTLGFTGLVPKSNDINSNNYKLYTDFDQLMVDNEGNHLIVDNGWFWNNFYYNSDFNFSSDIFACGPNIKKRNDEECMKLYNPSTYEPGSSFLHLDTTTYPRNILKPDNSADEYPLWNKYEIGIMEDLGYQIDWDNYCQFVDNIVFQPITLTINMEALKGNNCYFKLNKNQKDFPEECASTEVFNENFSVEFATGYLLQFFLNDHIVHEFNSIKDLKAFKNIHIIDKDYQIITKLKENVMHLTFKEIKPMEHVDNNPVKPKPIVKKPNRAKNKKKVAKKPNKKVDRKKGKK